VRDELESTEEEDPAAMLEIPDLTELLRLAFHVAAIDNDCCLVPHGAMKLTTAHEIERDEKYKGLSRAEVDNLENYSHFRVVQNKDKRELLEQDEAIFRANFLDDVSADRPKGCWSIQVVDMRTALIRNNVWRGFSAFATADSTRYGCCYVGNGLKNTSFSFM